MSGEIVSVIHTSNVEKHTMSIWDAAMEWCSKAVLEMWRIVL